MTLTLDLNETVAARLRAEADAQARPVAVVAADALAERYADNHSPYDEDDAPTTEADIRAIQEAFAAFDAGDRGKPAAQSFALVAARLGLKNTTL